MPKKSIKTSKSKSVKTTVQTKTYLDKISSEVQASQSKLSMILGALIILVAAILMFNYFSKGKEVLGPAQKTQIQQTEGMTTDVDTEGKYTVKEGDTLFLIAQKYYQDGYKYTELAKLNNLTDANQLEVGQVLNVPKMEAETVKAEVSPEKLDTSSLIEEVVTTQAPTEGTEWGSKISGSKYTVTAGDWLSKIAGRAYGDVMEYEKIAKANNITDPNLIEPGTVINIPR